MGLVLPNIVWREVLMTAGQGRFCYAPFQAHRIPRAPLARKDVRAVPAGKYRLKVLLLLLLLAAGP